jgi:hypothetical protein
MCIPLRNRVILPALISLCFLLTHPVFGQDCGPCSRPSVRLYDARIDLPDSKILSELWLWENLAWTHSAAQSRLQADAQECM